MAQMKTRWYSGKISTSSSVENKQNAKIEEPQISKTQFLRSSNHNSTHSKISLKKQAASGSFIQAGKNPDKESKQHYPKSGSTTSSNLTPENNFQLVPKNGICDQQIRQADQIANKSDEVEFNLSLKSITAYNKQQVNKPHAPVASIDFNYWFPYIFMQTLRRKLQESASELTANNLLELQYYENEMTSVTDCSNETCLERFYQTYPRHQPHAISYKCPRKKPKFKARYIEIRSTIDDIESLRTTSAKSLNSEHDANSSTCSPSSTEQNIKRNMSPATRSFKWPSDAELELNLASVSPSSVSSSESTTCSSSGDMSALLTLQTDELTPYEIPALPRDHELYLAAIEQLKNTIANSRKQRQRVDKENSLRSETSTEKKCSQSNETEEFSTSCKQKSKNEDEFATTDTSKSLKQRWKSPNYEKTNNQNKVLVKKENISCVKTQSKLSTAKSQLSQKKSCHSEKDLLRDRLKRFIEESKSVTTSLDVAAVSTSSKSRTLSRTDNLKYTGKKSSSSNVHIQSQLRRFIVASQAGSSSFETETATVSSQLRSAITSKGSDKSSEQQQISSRIFDNLKITTHDKEQLAAIDHLKQRLKRSIKEFKKRMIPSDRAHMAAATTTKTGKANNLKQPVKAHKDNSYSRHDYHNHSATANESKQKAKPPIKQTPRNKPQAPSENPMMKTFERNAVKKARESEQATKSRKQAPNSIRHQTYDHQKQPIKEPKKQGKPLPHEEHFTKSGILKSQGGVNKLKQSKAQTSLHFKNVGKENRSPTETSNSKQCKCKHENELTPPEPTRSRTTQTKVLHTELPTKPKRTSLTSTKGTQCMSSTDVLDETLIELENFSTEMDLKRLLSPHTTRSEALSAVLKFRYKSLIERARGEFAWLQLKKQRYKSKGLHEYIAAVRKKQQRILRKMESERSMIQQLLESALATSYLQVDSMESKARQRAKLTPSKSAPDIGTEGNESHEPTLSQRLQHVEYMLAWNFKLDQKEADITELEHMLLGCNKNLNLSPATSIKSLLYRISKVENRLAEINEKLETLESSAVLGASTQLMNEELPRPRSSSKLNQYWQSPKAQKCEKSMPKQRIETKLRNYYNEAETAAGFNDFRKFHEPSESSSTQYVLYDPTNYLQQDDSITNDDGIVVLYSPKVPSLNLNFSSGQSDLNKETLSTTSSVANSTFTISQRYTKSSTTDRKLNKSK